jgi:hypothetical protein
MPLDRKAIPRPSNFALTGTAQTFNLPAWDVHKHSNQSLHFTHATSPPMTINNQNNKNHHLVP